MHIPDCSRRSKPRNSYRPWGVVSVATAPKGFETILFSVRGRVAAREGEYNPERLPFGSPSPQRARRLACLAAPRTLGLAGLAHLLHRWDRRHRRDFLTVYLRTLAVLDVWRGTMFALAATTSGVLLHLSVGALDPDSAADLPGRPAEHADRLRGTGDAPGHAVDPQPVFQRPRLGCRHAARGGAGGAAGVGADPRRVGGPAPPGRRRSAGRAAGDDGGLYTVIVVYQFLANRSLPRWISGSLALLAGGSCRPRCLGSARARALRPAGLACWLAEVGGSVLSTAAILPLAIVFHAWLARRERRGETAAGDRPALSVLRETFDLRRSLAELRQTVTRLSQTLGILTDARHLIVQALGPRPADAGHLCTLLVGARHYRFAWIGLKREGDRVVFPAAQAGNGQEYLETVTITWDELPTGLGPMGSAIRENRAHVVVDTRTDERFRTVAGRSRPAWISCPSSACRCGPAARWWAAWRCMPTCQVRSPATRSNCSRAWRMIWRMGWAA